jgi:hypothetical protein
MGGSFAGIVVVIWAGFKIKKFWNYQSNANQMPIKGD